MKLGVRVRQSRKEIRRANYFFFFSICRMFWTGDKRVRLPATTKLKILKKVNVVCILICKETWHSRRRRKDLHGHADVYSGPIPDAAPLTSATQSEPNRGTETACNLVTYTAFTTPCEVGSRKPCCHALPTNILLHSKKADH